MKTQNIVIVSGLAISGLTFVACGESGAKDDSKGAGGDSSAATGGSNNSGSGGSNNTAGSESGTGGDGGEEHLYALTTQILGEEAVDNVSYVLLSTTLESGALDLEDALVEIPGRALGVGPTDGKALFVASDLAPTVTRYNLTESGGLELGNAVSFLGKGVTKFGEYGGQFQFISDEKAYWFDGPTAQIVIWNPKTMKVSGAISLASLASEGQTLTFTAAPVLNGTKLYSFAGWRLGATVPERAVVVEVDTTTDAVTIVESNAVDGLADCGYARDGVLADDGYLYIATEAYGTAVNYLNDANAATPCLLRYDTETSTFDASYSKSLNALVEGHYGGSLVLGPDRSVFLRMLVPGEIPAETTHPRVLASAPSWTWATLTLGDTPSATLIENAPLTGGSVLPFVHGSRFFAPVFVDGESTEFQELGTSGPIDGGSTSVPGLVFSSVRLK